MGQNLKMELVADLDVLSATSSLESVHDLNFRFANETLSEKRSKLHLNFLHPAFCNPYFGPFFKKLQTLKKY